MPAKPKRLTDLKIVVDRERVVRRLRGARWDSPSPIDRMIDRELVTGYGLMEPKASLVDLDVRSIKREKLELSCGFTLEGRSAAQFFSGCPRATVFVATIGSDLEEEVERRFTGGDQAGGLILDTIGSEATESLARKVQLIVYDRAQREGFSTTGRFSPGYGDFSLSTQKRILGVTQATEIGVSLTEGYMLVPRKSVSAVIGWRKE